MAGLSEAFTRMRQDFDQAHQDRMELIERLALGGQRGAVQTSRQLAEQARSRKAGFAAMLRRHCGPGSASRPSKRGAGSPSSPPTFVRAAKSFAAVPAQGKVPAESGKAGARSYRAMVDQGNGCHLLATEKPGAKASRPRCGPSPVSASCSPRSSKSLIERALGYLGAGYPINLAGPAGTGKTTLALHLAARLGQPVTLIHGDDEFGSSDLVGNDHGYRKSKLIDNFIHSVVKTEETMRTLWMDNRLTTACRYGHVLIYDEFTRSRPEANNVLLSVLGERLLNLPKPHGTADGYLDVHPKLPRHLHLESPGICRRPQEPGCAVGPADHDSHGPLRPPDGSGHRRRGGGVAQADRRADRGPGAPLPQPGRRPATGPAFGPPS